MNDIDEIERYVSTKLIEASREAYRQGILYTCIWCEEVIDPAIFATLQKFQTACNNHSGKCTVGKTTEMFKTRAIERFSGIRAKDSVLDYPEKPRG